MTRVTRLLLAAAALALAAAPALAQETKAQQQGQSGSRPAGGNPTTGTAVARPAGGGPVGGASAGASRPDGPSGIGPGASGSAGSVRGPRAVPRGGSAPARPAGAGIAGRTGAAPDADGPVANREVPQYSRPRGNQPTVGRATVRDGRTVVVGPTRPYVYPYGYYPYGYGYPYYGSYGLGFFYYDPYWWGYPGYGSGYGYGYGYGYSAQYGDTGQLRLKVKPRHAQVFVDGYYVGVVDEFDGIFQRLRLETGGHRVEIRLDGYEPITFDVLIPPGETITYRGELVRQLP